MYFHDTNHNNKLNGAAVSVPANNNLNYHHHYNNNINHYCNDAPVRDPQSLESPPDRRLSQRQSGNQAYIQKSVMNRQTGNAGGSSGTGGGYDAMDSCNTEATLLSDYGERVPYFNGEF